MGGDTPILGDFVSLIRGTTYQGALLGEVGPVLLGLATIAPEGGFRTGNYRTYGGESPQKLLLEPGELFVSLKDVTQAGTLLGAVARVPIYIEKGRLTQDTVKLVKASPDADMNYIYWLLRSPQYRELCKGKATGTTNLGLARDDFLSLPVPLLTSARRELCALLDLIEGKIEVNRRMAETLESIARALFKSWFVDFDPVHAKAAACSSNLRDDAAALFPDGFGEDGVPQGWTAGKILDIASLNPESWTAANRPPQLNYVDLANTKWGKIEAIQTFHTSESPSRAQRILRPGDTIVGTVRPGNGAYARVSKSDLTGSTGFAVLRPTKMRDSAFVYLAATSKHNIETLAALADGGAYPAVRPSLVGDTPCVIASQAVRDAFAQVVAPLYNGLSGLDEQCQTLVALRDALLPELISGKLHYRDAEQAAVAA